MVMQIVIDILNRQAGIVNGSINGLKTRTSSLTVRRPKQAFAFDIPVSQIERIKLFVPH